jgi:hypothetical protein
LIERERERESGRYMTVCVLSLGATKLRAMFLSPFSQLRERFETLAVVVNFSSFWAGKFRRHAKFVCVVVHHHHGVSPTKQNKNTKREGSKYKERVRDDISSGRRNFGRERNFD